MIQLHSESADPTRMAIIGTKCAGTLLDRGFSFSVVVGTLISELHLTKDEAVRAAVNAEHQRVPVWRRRPPKVTT